MIPFDFDTETAATFANIDDILEWKHSTDKSQYGRPCHPIKNNPFNINAWPLLESEQTKLCTDKIVRSSKVFVNVSYCQRLIIASQLFLTKENPTPDAIQQELRIIWDLKRHWCRDILKRSIERYYSKVADLPAEIKRIDPNHYECWRNKFDKVPMARWRKLSPAQYWHGYYLSNKEEGYETNSSNAPNTQAHSWDSLQRYVFCFRILFITTR